MNAEGLIVMGVSGSGKTTVGRMLAKRLGWVFLDADDYHPRANKDKMKAGIPLEDADRVPWLADLRGVISETLRSGKHPVLACSALKESYRRVLLEGHAGVRIVFLKGGYELIHSRMSGRFRHYMQPGMLRSQFDALEEPADAIVADISGPAEDVVDGILRALGEAGRTSKDEGEGLR